MVFLCFSQGFSGSPRPIFGAWHTNPQNQDGGVPRGRGLAPIWFRSWGACGGFPLWKLLVRIFSGEGFLCQVLEFVGYLANKKTEVPSDTEPAFAEFDDFWIFFIHQVRCCNCDPHCCKFHLGGHWVSGWSWCGAWICPGFLFSLKSTVASLHRAAKDPFASYVFCESSGSTWWECINMYSQIGWVAFGMMHSGIPGCCALFVLVSSWAIPSRGAELQLQKGWDSLRALWPSS